MRSVGFDQPLYILPFDHRASFQVKMFGWKGALSPEQKARIEASKQVIYARDQKCTREEAAAAIAARYRRFVDAFEQKPLDEQRK